MLCSSHLPMLKPQGHICISLFLLSCVYEQRNRGWDRNRGRKMWIILSVIRNIISPDEDADEPYYNHEFYSKNQSSIAWNQINTNPSTSPQKPKTKPSNYSSPNSTALPRCGLRYTKHMSPERQACTLYLRKAVWTRRAASYSSLCSGSDRVSWARSRSTLLLEALMNSLQSAGDGSVDLSREPSLSGDPPGLRLGLDDGVRGSL